MCAPFCSAPRNVRTSAGQQSWVGCTVCMRDWKFCSNQQDLKVQHCSAHSRTVHEGVFTEETVLVCELVFGWMGVQLSFYPFLSYVSFIHPDLHCFYGSVALQQPNHPCLQYTLSHFLPLHKLISFSFCSSSFSSFTMHFSLSLMILLWTETVCYRKAVLWFCVHCM